MASSGIQLNKEIDLKKCIICQKLTDNRGYKKVYKRVRRVEETNYFNVQTS